MDRQDHPEITCPRNVEMTVYCGKGWKSLFACPKCGRKTWQSLNFLGRREITCNGIKFTKCKEEKYYVG
jgi:hypothetical protein